MGLFAPFCFGHVRQGLPSRSTGVFNIQGFCKGKHPTTTFHFSSAGAGFEALGAPQCLEPAKHPCLEALVPLFSTKRLNQKPHDSGSSGRSLNSTHQNNHQDDTHEKRSKTIPKPLRDGVDSLSPLRRTLFAPRRTQSEVIRVIPLHRAFHFDAALGKALTISSTSTAFGGEARVPQHKRRQPRFWAAVAPRWSGTRG